MKHLSLAVFVAVASTGVWAQETSGVQFSGVLSANLINDFLASTAYADSGGGLSFLQLDAAMKDGPYGFDTLINYGPGGGVGLVIKDFYGYAGFAGGAIYLALGRWIDPNTFALNSFFQGGPDGPGSYGNPSTPNKNGGSGGGINGLELKVTPTKNLVLGFVLPYNPYTADSAGVIIPQDTVDTSLRHVAMAASYTVEKVVQVVMGYAQSHTGVADMSVPQFNLGQNKFFTLANVLVSDNLTLGARYELDHYVSGKAFTSPDVSSWHVISNNGYLTAGEKIGDLSFGGDVGLYVPQTGPAGMEILASGTYTIHGIARDLDFQPEVSVSFINHNYLGNTDDTVNVNPQLRLLLGKSQHELALGYSVTQDLTTRKVALSQMNALLQVYF